MTKQSRRKFSAGIKAKVVFENEKLLALSTDELIGMLVEAEWEDRHKRASMIITSHLEYVYNIFRFHGGISALFV
jgi:hypothetical protein